MMPGPRPESAGSGWRAPGRVNLIGDHTDHQDGWCLPLALDRECRIAVTAGPPGELHAQSDGLPGEVTVPADGAVDPATVSPAWGRLVAAAAAVVADDCGSHPGGATLTIASTVPVGSGLSSSAATAVALVGALADAAGRPVDDPVRLARLAREAEVRATGVPCGLLDQMAATHAVPDHALLLDCRSLAVTPVPIPPSIGFVVVHSGQTRRLEASGYAQARDAAATAAARLGLPALRDATEAQVADDPAARHVVRENARVLAFARALPLGDLDRLGRLMLESHASLRDDFAVSTPTLDRTVDRLLAAGAAGARLTGAGFGGCVVAVTAADRAADVLDRVAAACSAAGEPEPLAFVARPGRAAGPIG